MIYTITLNPALDYNLELEKVELGKLNLSNKAYFLGGGKGINVSKVLKNLNIDSIALGFVGGFTGTFIKNDLEIRGVKEEFVEVEGSTRINIKLKENSCESEIAGLSPQITEEKIQILFEKLRKITSKDIVVMSGSVPKGITNKIYLQIMEQLPKGVKVILDARGEAFKEALKGKPFLVKPNIHELEEFLERKINTLEEIVQGARDIQKCGAQNVVVSMGKDGSILCTEGSIYKGNVPKGVLRNSVGAGDSMVAGIVAQLARDKEIAEAYKFGIASGSATAFSYELCTLEEIESLIKEVEVIKN